MSTLQIKRNETATVRPPTTGQLLAGELAVDLASRTLYSALTDGTIVALGGGVSEGSEVTIPAGGTTTLVLPSYVTNPIDAVVSVKVRVGAIWYDAYGVATLRYNATQVTLTNNSSESYLFRYKFLRG